MNKKNKLMTLLSLLTAGTTSIALMNKWVQLSAVQKNLMDEPDPLCYKWRLGNIHYTKSGSGRPLLLIHDLNASSSGYEYHLLTDKLSRRYTVYTLDLLGCGRSEKPNLTYTSYLFVQLICDFIKSEIGRRTDLIVSGASSPFVIMACNHSPELFGRLMLINPDSFDKCMQVPGKHAKFLKLLLDLPIIGTLLYQITTSHAMIEKCFQEQYFYNPYCARPAYIDHYYESAYLGDSPKAIFSSLECRYTNCNIRNALRKIDNSIYIVGGSEEPEINKTIREYQSLNSAIESSIITKTRHLPQLETPEKLLELIHIFFA